jgi:predicted O-linked N-acetylglucosamine transferase (SPINDLY family)
LQIKRVLAYAINDSDFSVTSSPSDEAATIAGLREQGRLQDALRVVAGTASNDPRVAVEILNLGVAFERSGDIGSARTCYARAVEMAPHFAPARQTLGVALLHLGDPWGAAVHFEHAARLQPTDEKAWIGLTLALLNSGRGGQALASIEHIRGAFADSAQCWAWRGSARAQLGQDAAALEDYAQALQRDARCYDAVFGKALILERSKRLSEAAELYRIASELNPASNWALGNLVYCLRSINDWANLAEPEAILCERLRHGNIGDYATQWLGLPLPAATFRAIAATHMRRESAIRVGNAKPAPFGTRKPGRIRVAYVTSEFRRHPRSFLIVRLLEQHDRKNFEVFAYSTAPSDGSDIRHRVEAACEHFIEISGMPAPKIAQRMREDGIDIWIDLNGHTSRAVYGLAALRPAPVNVNFLGFAGTNGAFTDYIIGDAHVTPRGSDADFSECIVRMPHCYQPNDELRTVAPATTRAAHGLPDDAIVACSFNVAWKFTQSLWACWMRVMNAHPRMVLWLIDNNPDSTRNLRQAAQDADIDPVRIVFARRIPQAEHLARTALADLALDTSPFNSHTTGSDALWMGVPMLTLRGDTFDARVGASLLAAAGLPELITTSAADYEEKLMNLLSSPAQLAAMKTDCLRRRDSSALFDSRAHARALESAFTRMHERSVAGLQPESFDVPDSTSGTPAAPLRDQSGA